MSESVARKLNELAPPEFLTVAQVANILRVSPRQVYRWVDGGQLRAIRLGRIVHIHRSDLDAFIERLRTDKHHLSDAS